MRTVDKAFAYVTCGERLLVLDHVGMPEAGIQVPAGTIAAGETPAAAALREAEEETGLRGFAAPVWIGVAEFDARPWGKDELHRRHFFHLRFGGSAPERWRHEERDAADGSGPILFELYWVALDAVPELIAGHGAFLDVLRRGGASRP